MIARIATTELKELVVAAAIGGDLKEGRILACGSVVSVFFMVYFGFGVEAW